MFRPFRYLLTIKNVWLCACLLFSYQALAEKVSVTIGVAEKGWAPFEYIENGKPTGYLVEYMELVAQQGDIEINWDIVPDRAALLEAGKSGRHDLITYAAKVDKYKSDYTFGEEVVPRYIAAFTHKDANLGTVTRSKLSELVLATPSAFQITRLMKQHYADVQLLETTSIRDALFAVASGKADIAFADLAVGLYAINTGLLPDIDISFSPDFINTLFKPIHLIYSKKSPDSVKEVLEHARKQIPQKELEALQEKWRLKIQTNLNKVTFTQEELDWIAQAPTINVGSFEDLPPFSFEKNGEITGYSIDYLKLIEKKTGLDFNIVSGRSWTEQLQMAENRTIDVMQLIRPREDIGRFMTFTRSYISGSANIVYGRTGQAPLSSLDDIGDKTLAVFRDFVEQRYISQHFPDVKLRLIDSTGQGLNAILRGEADYLLCNSVTCDTYMYQNFISNISAVGHLGVQALENNQEASFAIRNDWLLLQSIFNKAIKSVTVSEIAVLKDEWLNRAHREHLVIEALSDEERQWLDQNQRLAFSATLKMAPYSFINQDGKYSGIGSDILERFEQQYKVATHLVRYPSWKSVLDAFDKGEIDFIPALFITDTRKKKMLFTQPLLQVELNLFTRTDSPLIHSLSHAKGLKIGVTKGSAGAAKVQSDYPDLNILQYGNLQQNVQALADGELDVIVGNPFAIEYLARSMHISNIISTGETGYTYDLAFAVQPSKPELVSLLNKTLSTFDDEQLELITDKWNHLRIVNKSDWMSVIPWVVGSATLFIIIVLSVSAYTRKKTLIKLKKAGQKLEDAQRVAKLGSWSVDSQNKLIKLSLEASNILGIAKNKDMTRVDYVQMIHEPDRANYLSSWDVSLKTGLVNQEYRIQTESGLKWVNEIAELTFDDQGKLLSGSAIIQDISLFKASQETLLTHQKELRELTSKLLSVQEEERRRVARELHDDLSQRLAAISIEAGTLEMSVTSDTTKTALRHMKSQLVSIAEDTHGLSRRLHPSILDDLGLVDALRSEIDNYRRKADFTVDFVCTSQHLDLSNDVALVFFRVVQEGLRNIDKYSEASRVNVSLNIIKDHIVLQIQDDGMGFDVEAARKAPGLGLKSMMERARLINGELNIYSEEYKGTTIELSTML